MLTVVNGIRIFGEQSENISKNYEDLGDAWLSNALKVDDFGLDFKTLSELFTNPIFGRARFQIVFCVFA